MGLFDKFKKPKAQGEPQRVKAMGLLFLPEPDGLRALDQVEDLFGLERGKPTNNLTLRQGDMEIFLAVHSLSDEGENGKYAKDQLQGAAGYVYQVKTDHTDIKLNLFYHLRMCKSIMQIIYSFPSKSPRETAEKEKQVMAPIFQMAEALRGVLTFGDGRSMLDCRGRLILNKDGKTELAYYMPAEPLPAGDHWKDAPREVLERRDRSLALLGEKHIYVTWWLPLLDEKESDGPARSPEEICGRAAALLAVSLYSECRLGEKMSYQEAMDFVRPIMNAYGAEKYLSPKEKQYLDNPDSSKQEQIQFAWQYENLWVMEWALGLTDDLFWPDRICDVPACARIMRENPDMESLLAAAKVRPYGEFLNQADLIYRIRWACEDARIMAMPAPQRLESGVAMERHRALFWLAGCGGRCGWDEVDLST